MSIVNLALAAAVLIVPSAAAGDCAVSAGILDPLAALASEPDLEDCAGRALYDTQVGSRAAWAFKILVARGRGGEGRYGEPPLAPSRAVTRDAAPLFPTPSATCVYNCSRPGRDLLCVQVAITFAKHVEISYGGYWKVVETTLVDNTTHTLLLVAEGCRAPGSSEWDGTPDAAARVPIRATTVSDTSTISFVEAIGERPTVKAQGTLYGVTSPCIHWMVQQNLTAEIGWSGETDTVKAAGVCYGSPSTIALPRDSNAAAYVDAMIPALPMANYRETSPIGSAEYIKVIGALFDKEAEANAFFAETEARMACTSTVAHAAAAAAGRGDASKKQILYIGMSDKSTDGAEKYSVGSCGGGQAEWYCELADVAGAAIYSPPTPAADQLCYAGWNGGADTCYDGYYGAADVAAFCEEADVILYQGDFENDYYGSPRPHAPAVLNCSAVQAGYLFDTTLSDVGGNAFNERRHLEPDLLLEDFATMLDYTDTPRERAFLRQVGTDRVAAADKKFAPVCDSVELAAAPLLHLSRPCPEAPSNKEPEAPSNEEPEGDATDETETGSRQVGDDDDAAVGDGDDAATAARLSAAAAIAAAGVVALTM